MNQEKTCSVLKKVMNFRLWNSYLPYQTTPQQPTSWILGGASTCTCLHQWLKQAARTCLQGFRLGTLPETNVAPENGWLEDYYSFLLVFLRPNGFSFREGICWGYFQSHSHSNILINTQIPLFFQFGILPTPPAVPPIHGEQNQIPSTCLATARGHRPQNGLWYSPHDWEF